MFAEWQVGQVLWSAIWITLFVLWIMLVIRVFADIFRSKDLGGVAKVLWLLFVIVLPFLGVFAYLIARGHKMAEHDVADAQAQESALRDYIRDAAGTPANPAAELERLAALRADGTIDDAEFDRLKARVLG
jgi:hypothetical protein